ncbi:Putative AC transposase [Rhizoctonia solani]|uniref:Putative AC transposase n=1 Tax=Rhizoctonia solani TaxID=456999 RepID=A0A0K6FZU4_9AGAM|nr:Putative AC transposase [Rhizoctonia solani]
MSSNLPPETIPPPVPLPKARRRRPRAIRSINDLSDAEAWSYSDQDICDAALAAWKADIYKTHYIVTLTRHTKPVIQADGSINEVPDYMEYRFDCKYGNLLHLPVYRRRDSTGTGTGNLHSTMKTCLGRRSLAEKYVTTPISTAYSYVLHIAILIMSCAYHYIPFARFRDDLFLQQVDLLRPGTAVPDSSTLSRLTKYAYMEQARHVRTYFQGVGTIHLAVDGWTSPTSTAYIGLVIHWYSEGKLWRAVLEFIRLKKRHTGAYLASKVFECLQRYGLDQKFLSVCLDNASNNDTLVRGLAQKAPSFHGAKSRIRCAAHVTNLMVKAFIEHFMKPATRKRKAVKYKKSCKRQQTEQPSNCEAQENEVQGVVEIVIDEGEDAGDLNSDVEEDGLEEDAAMLDADRALHDTFVIKETTTEAVQFARKLKFPITDSMLALARGVLSKAASLACKLHDSPTLQAKFEALIEASLSQLKTGRRALARRVPTRWNSDYECLLSLLELRPCVKMLTADSENNLQDLALDKEQWVIVEQLVWVLKIFKEISNLFSRADEPVVHQVIPMFVRIRRRLEAVRMDQQGKLHPLIRAAAHSALLVDNKYMDAFADSEVYWISLVMCPNLKLQWLQDNGFSKPQVDAIYQVVVNRFNSTYKGKSGADAAVVDLQFQDEDEESEDPGKPDGFGNFPSCEL